jgi:hypothetical protein
MAKGSRFGRSITNRMLILIQGCRSLTNAFVASCRHRILRNLQ